MIKIVQVSVSVMRHLINEVYVQVVVVVMRQTVIKIVMRIVLVKL